MASILANFGDSAPLISKDGSIPNALERPIPVPQEPYVDAQRVAEHLSLTRREVLKLTRAKKLPAHAIDPSATRKIYRYKLSEIDMALSVRLITEETLGRDNAVPDNDDRQPRHQKRSKTQW